MEYMCACVLDFKNMRKVILMGLTRKYTEVVK